MLLGEKKPTNFVCIAKLSERLPMWSNTKHCAECPPLTNVTGQPFDTTAPFGLIDDTAAVYFDFWSERRGRLSPADTLYQSMHDVNGPFNTSCSLSRATGAFGHAGQFNFTLSSVALKFHSMSTLKFYLNTTKRIYICTGVAGADYCVDCFGDECIQRSNCIPPAAAELFHKSFVTSPLLFALCLYLIPNLTQTVHTQNRRRKMPCWRLIAKRGTHAKHFASTKAAATRHFSMQCATATRQLA